MVTRCKLKTIVKEATYLAYFIKHYSSFRKLSFLWVFKFALFKYAFKEARMNNSEIDQEKQNKTVARWKLITT